MNTEIRELLAELVDRQAQQMAYGLAQAQQQMAQSLNGVLLKGALPVALPLAGLGAGFGGDPMLARSPGCIVGWNLREIVGTAKVSANLHDGYDASAPIVATVELNASLSSTGPLTSNPGGVFFSVGLFLEIIGTGVLGGVFYLRGTD